MPNNETKVLDEEGAILLTSNIKTLADATYPANAAMAQLYSTSSSYSVGDYCLHNGLFYRCITAIPVGGEVWTAVHWQQVNTSEELERREPRKLQFTNISISSSAFIEDQTYENYPYRASISLTGVTISMYPEIIFDNDEATSGLFSPVAQSYNGGIYLYATQIPSKTSFIIPNIICWTRDVDNSSIGELNVADEIQAIEDELEGIKPKILTITLFSANWTGSGPYYQTISINDVVITENTAVDLRPNTIVLTQMISDGVKALFIENNSGILTAVAIQAPPTTDLTLQCSLIETTVL